MGQSEACALFETGLVSCWHQGEAVAKPLSEVRRAIEIASVGAIHCARLSDATVRCFRVIPKQLATRRCPSDEVGTHSFPEAMDFASFLATGPHAASLPRGTRHPLSVPSEAWLQSQT